MSSRIKLIGAVSDEELLALYGRAAAIFFAPLNEDYGFVTVEAFSSRKPVVTCRDSGGITELVSVGQPHTTLEKLFLEATRGEKRDERTGAGS